jgi:transketolase
MTMTTTSAGPFKLAPRRAYHLEIPDPAQVTAVDSALVDRLERYDLMYRTICAILYNFVPTSGHPGGSISSGRIVSALLFGGMDYDMTSPERQDADIMSYAAGHKAMGLYSMWALRNEVTRVGRPDMLSRPDRQLRLEDLLGFRRNPTNKTALFLAFHAKPLDGHPTPFTPFVRLATGASGVGVPASLGLAMGAMDVYGAKQAPRVHLLEGEGGMTAGRVTEALAIGATAQLSNAILHLDWNQASIDSNRVCREGDMAGDYVQWNPAELAYLNDWNVIRVADGLDFHQVLAAHRIALERRNDQPTAIVYRTVKGWRYGIEGRASHGAGHKFCSPEYDHFLQEFETAFGVKFPRFDGNAAPDNVEKCFWDSLLTVRGVVEKNKEWAQGLAGALAESKARLDGRKRTVAPEKPKLAAIYSDAIKAEVIPPELALKPGSSTTLRAALGDTLNYLNKASQGGILAAAADLLGSTSVTNVDKGFPEGFYSAVGNPQSRLVSCGGICEDAMGAFMAGLSSYGCHIGAGASYGAFIAALQHVPARLHAIGQQARKDLTGESFKTFIIICAHAGLKTGEDGPTHADPQPLQLLQENFPTGAVITLTPWEPQELWPLTVAALKARPAVLAPFVTRPNETVPDRAALRIPPAAAAIEGVYAIRRADPAKKPHHGTIVLQESGVAYAFVDEVLPEIDKRGLNMNIFYVASAELFDLVPQKRREEIFPAALAREAMGITGFTLPTLYRWIDSAEGRARTLHPFRHGRFLGSGQADKVMEEAGLDGPSQLAAVLDYAKATAAK